MDEIEIAEKEVNDNYEYFKKMLPEWEIKHPSKFALIHNQELGNFFESENDAIMVGIDKHGFGGFSVQPVSNHYIDLGHQSHALF